MKKCCLYIELNNKCVKNFDYLPYHLLAQLVKKLRCFFENLSNLQPYEIQQTAENCAQIKLGTRLQRKQTFGVICLLFISRVAISCLSQTEIVVHATRWLQTAIEDHLNQMHIVRLLMLFLA